MQYRRVALAGGTYFFTVNLANRKSSLLLHYVDILREVVRAVQVAHPFHIDAMVILPEHLHALWTLPADDADYPTRWMLIKGGFSRHVPEGEQIGRSRRCKGERGIWQRRYWEHCIRDDRDFARHVNYIHYNPVKHGHVRRVAGWPSGRGPAFTATFARDCCRKIGVARRRISMEHLVNCRDHESWGSRTHPNLQQLLYFGVTTPGSSESVSRRARPELIESPEFFAGGCRMDALSEAMRAVRVTGALFFNGEFAEPWRFATPAQDQIGPTISPDSERLVLFHLVTHGHATARTTGYDEVSLAAGDIVVFPHGDAHEMWHGRTSKLFPEG